MAKEASTAAEDLARLDHEGKQRAGVEGLYAKNRAGGADHESSAAGDELMRKAAKKADKWFGGSKNKDKACELYEQAAAAYKMNDNWAEAAGALLKCAEILEKQKDSLEAAGHYVEAGLCMARVDNEEAIKLLEMGIAIHTNEARLGAAARVWKELAQLHEDEENLQAAIDAWRKAADCQESEGTLAGALQSLLRVGELCVKEYQFKKASKVYERCAEICVDKNINKGSLRDYFYNALLCQFVVSARKGSLKNLESMYERFLEIDRKFAGTWQQTLIKNCMAAFEDGDPNALAQAVYDQNQRHKLDDLSTKILLEIKNILKNPPKNEEAEEIGAQLQ